MCSPVPDQTALFLFHPLRLPFTLSCDHAASQTRKIMKLCFDFVTRITSIDVSQLSDTNRIIVPACVRRADIH